MWLNLISMRIISFHRHRRRLFVLLDDFLFAFVSSPHSALPVDARVCVCAGDVDTPLSTQLVYELRLCYRIGISNK